MPVIPWVFLWACLIFSIFTGKLPIFAYGQQAKIAVFKGKTGKFTQFTIYIEVLMEVD
jgi:hypothetical protein